MNILPSISRTPLNFFLPALAWLGLSFAVQNADATQAASVARPFRMGFTAFPHDTTIEAVEETRRFVRANADLI